jgi:hypothetical protein
MTADQVIRAFLHTLPYAAIAFLAGVAYDLIREGRRRR